MAINGFMHFLNGGVSKEDLDPQDNNNNTSNPSEIGYIPEGLRLDKRNNTVKKSITYVVYINITNFDQLRNAIKAEKHEQWDIEIQKSELNAGDGRLKVSEVQDKDGKVKHLITVKNVKDEEIVESVSNISKSLFDAFAFLSTTGSIREKYYFPSNTQHNGWVINVFPDGFGGRHGWGFAELEVEEQLEKIPKLPIEVNEAIMPGDQDDPENRKKIDVLWAKVFTKPNKHLKQAHVDRLIGDESEEADDSKPSDSKGSEDTDQDLEALDKEVSDAGKSEEDKDQEEDSEDQDETVEIDEEEDK